jgi:hypothetical protein
MFELLVVLENIYHMHENKEMSALYKKQLTEKSKELHDLLNMTETQMREYAVKKSKKSIKKSKKSVKKSVKH